MPYKKYKKGGDRRAGAREQASRKEGKKARKQKEGREGMRNTSRQSESFELALLMSWVDVCWGRGSEG